MLLGAGRLHGGLAWKRGHGFLVGGEMSAARGGEPQDSDKLGAGGMLVRARP